MFLSKLKSTIYCCNYDSWQRVNLAHTMNNIVNKGCTSFCWLQCLWFVKVLYEHIRQCKVSLALVAINKVFWITLLLMWRCYILSWCLCVAWRQLWDFGLVVGLRWDWCIMWPWSELTLAASATWLRSWRTLNWRNMRLRHLKASTQVHGNGFLGNIQVTHLTLCSLILFLMSSLFGLLPIGDICLHSVTLTVIEIS